MITTDLPQYDDTVEITLETVIRKEDQILEEIAVESEATRQYVKAETDGINLNMKEINSTLGTDDVIPLDKLIIKMARPFSDRVIITSNSTWVVPKNVNQIRVSGCASGSGQKAGAYKYEELINVVEGQEIPITVGSGNTVFGTYFSLVAGSLSEAFPNLKLGYETGINGRDGSSEGGAGGKGGFGGAFGFGGGGGGGATSYGGSASGGASGGDPSKGQLIYLGGTRGTGSYIGNSSNTPGVNGIDGGGGSIYGGGKGGNAGRSNNGYSGAGGGGAAGGYGAGAGQGGGRNNYGGGASDGQASPGVIIIEY